jgi:tRNA nucleotidyltransferase/poly(A) polymerase
MKVLDMSIDINNFREEIYHPGSRIPEITLSTAKEDALRRDFTINGRFASGD